MTPLYKSPTFLLGITGALLSALDFVTQSGIVTDQWWQSLVVFAIGVLTAWRRAIKPPATAEEMEARVEGPKS